MKPRQPALQGAKSDEYVECGSDSPVFVLRQMRSDFEARSVECRSVFFFMAPNRKWGCKFLYEKEQNYYGKKIIHIRIRHRGTSR